MRILMAVMAVMLLLSGCATKLISDPHLVSNPPVSIPVVRPMALKNVHYGVLPATSPAAQPVITLTPDNYRNLQSDGVEIQRWAQEMSSLVTYLKTAIAAETK